ncbi:hypothetical protein BDZ89DRAFT_1130718 [Hymenopellis radicata]|nr:hypothetical protein BDZ89DRAFT_1142705 [Hymenopellis radicata]KAF9034152.1 hypothetical protein BDZ89DRAFT_1130718 [Hymenopellis radicata]
MALGTTHDEHLPRNIREGDASDPATPYWTALKAVPQSVLQRIPENMVPPRDVLSAHSVLTSCPHSRRAAYLTTLPQLQSLECLRYLRPHYKVAQSGGRIRLFQFYALLDDFLCEHIGILSIEERKMYSFRLETNRLLCGALYSLTPPPAVVCGFQEFCPADSDSAWRIMARFNTAAALQEKAHEWQTRYGDDDTEEEDEEPEQEEAECRRWVDHVECFLAGVRMMKSVLDIRFRAFAPDHEDLWDANTLPAPVTVGHLASWDRLPHDPSPGLYHDEVESDAELDHTEFELGF